jgi:capsular exopolysaccharide synthesis family protein
MELRQYLEFLKRRLPLLLILPLLAGLAAYFGTQQVTPTYRATTSVLVNQTQAPGVLQYNDILTSERLTSTYAQMVELRPIISQVNEQLGLQLTDQQLKDKIEVAPVRNTQLLRITAEDHDPVTATLIANATARIFIADNGGKTGLRPGTISVAELADVPRTPASPNLRLNIAMAVICGLLLAGLAALLFEYLDDTVKGAREIEEAGLATLGTVRRTSSRSTDATLKEVPSEALIWEEYRQVRTNVHFSLLGSEGKSILVTSPNAREGKTTTAMGLAAVLAQAGHKVILIDTDLRRPALNRLVNSHNSFGLTGLLLSETANVTAAMVKTPHPNLRLIPSGPVPPNPSELLMSEQFWRIIVAARSMADYLILDSPPVLPVTDAMIIAERVDATILVVESGKTRSGALQRARLALGQAQARVIGVVVNKAKSRRSAAYYGYRYNKAERAEQAEQQAEQVAPSLTLAPEARPQTGDAGTAITSGARLQQGS